MVGEDCWQIFHIAGQDTGRCPPNLHSSKDGQAGNRHIFGRFIRVRPMNPIKRIHYNITTPLYKQTALLGVQVNTRQDVRKSAKLFELENNYRAIASHYDNMAMKEC